MIRLSTGFVNQLMTFQGVAQMLSYGSIDIYTGAMPQSPDDAPTGTRVGYISTGGAYCDAANFMDNGLVFDLGPTPGTLVDDGRWVLSRIAFGTAGWWRFRTHMSDDNQASEVEPRIDGTMSECFLVSSKDFEPGPNEPVQFFKLSLPLQSGT